MDPLVRNYLMQSDPRFQQYATSMDQSPADSFVAGLGQNQGPVATPNLQDPPPEDTQSATPSQRAPASSQNKVPQVPDIQNDLGTLSDDELARYGIHSPEEIEALKQQRMQMGNDLASQANGNVLAKIMAQASDNIASTGNRIMAGNESNNAPAVANMLDQNLQQQGAKVQAFDDANEKLGEQDYNRLKDLDNKRLAIQQLRDAAQGRQQYHQDMLEQTRAIRDQNRNDRLNKQDQDEWNKYTKGLDFKTKSSRSAVGVASNNLQRVNNVLDLLSQPMTKQDRFRVGNDMNTLISGLASVSGAEHSTYNDLANKLQNAKNAIDGGTWDTMTDAQRQHEINQVRQLSLNFKATLAKEKKLFDINFSRVRKSNPDMAAQYDQLFDQEYGNNPQPAKQPTAGKGFESAPPGMSFEQFQNWKRGQ